jgi:nucleotide-binding universal stress UspA family protein
MSGPDDADVGAGGGPVMLALSTFRRSGRAIEVAFEKAEECGRLLILHVADVNLARYLIGTDLGLYPEIKRRCEAELLEEHEAQGREHAEEIALRARERGLDAIVRRSVGRFAHVCLEVAERESPCLIVTTRSRRPAWVRRFFGSPVDRLIAEAPCPVIEA